MTKYKEQELKYEELGMVELERMSTGTHLFDMGMKLKRTYADMGGERWEADEMTKPLVRLREEQSP